MANQLRFFITSLQVIIKSLSFKHQLSLPCVLLIYDNVTSDSPWIVVAVVQLPFS